MYLSRWHHHLSSSIKSENGFDQQWREDESTFSIIIIIFFSCLWFTHLSLIDLHRYKYIQVLYTCVKMYNTCPCIGEYICTCVILMFHVPVFLFVCVRSMNFNHDISLFFVLSGLKASIFFFFLPCRGFTLCLVAISIGIYFSV